MNMYWLSGNLVRRHPIIKIMVYLNLCILAVWGPLFAGSITSLVSFVIILYWPKRNGAFTNPWFSLLLCGLAVVLVIPGGTSQTELTYVTMIALRMLAVILVSQLLGLVFGVNDILILARILHFPKQLSVLTVAFVRFVPIAQRSIEAVILSQKSRGFFFGWKTMFLPTTYRVILVPFLVSILRDALYMWVSMNMRQWAIYKPRHSGVGLSDMFFLVLTFTMWGLPR